MQQSAEPVSNSSSFASLLASLAAPARTSSPAWEDDLAGDVATLSYESALRAHARYKPSPEPGFVPESPAPAQNSAAASAPALPLKCASITIRMSAEECAQLRRRAAEAGMTVSAYLRSCTFEAESLRAQVREVVAELRAAASAPAPPAQPVAPAPTLAPRTPRSWRAFFERLLPLGHALEHPARA